MRTTEEITIAPAEELPNKPRLVVLTTEELDVPPRIAALTTVETSVVTNAAELAVELPTADALLVWDFHSRLLHDFDATHARRLVWVHTASTGLDAVSCPLVRDASEVVTHVRGVFDEAIAEWVVGVLLVFVKDIHGTLAYQRQRWWVHRETQMLANSEMVVVGAGRIGTAIATKAAAMGVSCRGIARQPRAARGPWLEIAGRDQMLTMLSSADHVVVTLPETSETVGLFDAEVFSAMRQGAFFVNVGRGAVVVEESLIEALESEHLAGAALDVFATEPLPPDSPLWGLQTVIVSPHMSGDFVGWRHTLAEHFLDNLGRWLAGHELNDVAEKADL